MGAPKQTPHRIEGTTRILSASVDANLNYTRALLLRHHGFEVTTSESVQDAQDQIQAYNFDVLVFGSTLPRDICWQLAGLFRSRNAQGKIIEILPSPWATAKNNPDATVVSSDEPTSLVETIRQRLGS
jgi:DNA-binding NtrC family response regulator